MQIKGLGHASVRIDKNDNKKIYIDPYDIKENPKDASYIFITHNHYDHYSFKDIEKLANDDTVFIVPKNMVDQLISDLEDAKYNVLDKNNILEVEPNNRYFLGDDLDFSTVCAYNVDANYHKKEDKNVGYILNIENEKIYISGDTDDIALNFFVDYAIVPIGGTYTMDSSEAANFINRIKPKHAICYHYGKIVGSIKDRDNFVKLLDKSIDYIEIN